MYICKETESLTLETKNLYQYGESKKCYHYLGIHPFLLNAQMYLWSNGIRSWSYYYYLS
jgi:hypothetical protein